MDATEPADVGGALARPYMKSCPDGCKTPHGFMMGKPVCKVTPLPISSSICGSGGGEGRVALRRMCLRLNAAVAKIASA